MANPRIPLRVVVAAAQHNGIGLAGGIPWNLPGDRAFFRRVTSEVSRQDATTAVIMGRRTWESLPARVRPLPRRVNVVLSRDATFCEQLGADVVAADSLDAALAALEARDDVETAFAIGGARVYCAALNHPACDRVYLTRVLSTPDCDTFLPEIQRMGWTQTAAEPEAAAADGEPGYVIQTFERAPPAAPAAPAAPAHEEMQYLDAIRDIMETGVRRGDRTGTGTLSKFGVRMRFSLRDDTLPLFTTKRVFWRGVAEELLWFVRGCTSELELAAKNVHIWGPNASREFLDGRGLQHREVGDLGPVYGFQWRHFGAEYVDMHADYSGQGVDQLAGLIETIKTNPTDRRMLLTAWNPAALHLMALPPCHLLAQFYVANGELSCQLYQRSGDMGLGVPFNVASYSLLTRMIAQVCGLRAGEFVHVIGDAHVYLNHVEPLQEQLTREPRPFPKLRINPDVDDIDSFTMDDFTVEDYRPHKKIAMEMAV